VNVPESDDIITCPSCGDQILKSDPGAGLIGESVVCGSCIAEFYLRFVSETKCLACGAGGVLLLGNGQWICLAPECKACSPEFDDPRNLRPLARFFGL
jgi:hypothetical protein